MQRDTQSQTLGRTQSLEKRLTCADCFHIIPAQGPNTIIPNLQAKHLLHYVSCTMMSELDCNALPSCMASVASFTWRSESSGQAAAVGSFFAEALSGCSETAAGTACWRLAKFLWLTAAPWVFLHMQGHVSIVQDLYSLLLDPGWVPLLIGYSQVILHSLGSEGAPVLTGLLVCTALMLRIQKLEI